MKRPTSLQLVMIFTLAIFGLTSTGLSQGNLRPPAVPLVTCDPYFSIWSQADRLTDKPTTHWTGRPHRLMSSMIIDGQSYRVMGDTPVNHPAMKQIGLRVFPTRTIYDFEQAGIKLRLAFITPALPEDLDLLSWPITYIRYDLTSMDGKDHQVSISFEASSEIAVDDARQATVWTSPSFPGLSTLAVGSESQDVLNRSGDDLRIDWGHLYISAPAGQHPKWDEHRLNFALDKVDSKPSSCWLMLAYDDQYSIQYMQRNLRPYWRRNGWEAQDLLQNAASRFSELQERCERFDEELIADLKKAGGDDYASLGSLCYRQCFAAGKFVADANGQPLQFCKENHSNGCIATSDVFYPMAPQFLLFGPTLAKSFLVPFMNYAASDRWKFPFAPHDLGQYPLANGQVYGGGEISVDNQMPVEECGNLLLLMAAVAHMEGSPEFANRYWKQIEQWAEYLKGKGFDPENQLCTDDFAGHLAHNVNLSAKAICAIGAYGRLCEMRGEIEKGREALELARVFAKRWMEEADDGDHYRLAFDKPGSWSQKYNIVWDRILGLDVFPDSVAEKEMAYYRANQGEFGLALDNRATYTKLDWVLWTATLTQKREDFDALLRPVIRFIQETPDRSPLTDWYETKSARKVGFTARPVVGGVFLQMLYDKTVWAKWASRDKTKASNWAPMPKLPIVTQILKTASEEPSEWFYTTTQPNEKWYGENASTEGWARGKSGFGTVETPNALVNTKWSTSDIWMVKDIEVDSKLLTDLQWLIHHDEDTEVYVNGELAAKFTGYTVKYKISPLSAVAKSLFKPGKNRIAVHCHQTAGGQFIDVGLVTVKEAQ